ncbi:uncharacterized protein LOC112203446 [Rosa chinensis]|uniref:uncharacterized protein LOC112203446 n=1 Tax=Rosa chinensis TaxID=74649 RepID=UPI000D09243C|nr:uncharacterized protein LOC112203446 [Rosa chinensis]
MDLDLLSWNCRGIYNDATTRALKDLISQNRPQIVFLCETKISREGDFENLRKTLGFVNAKAVFSEGQAGGLGLFWNDDVHLNVGTTSAHHMDAVVIEESGSPSWRFDLFGHSKLFHLPPSDSDHVPLLLKASTAPLVVRSKQHCFKFEAFWLQHLECDGVVKEAWGTDVAGAPMFCVAKKIAHTRLQLDRWQKQVFRGRQLQMRGIRSRLEELLEVPVSVEVQGEKKTLMDKLQSLLYREELFWRQRAKVTWLKEGDQVVTNYFAKMFMASEIDYEAVDKTLEAITPVVTPEMNSQFCSPYTQDEVRCALFQMYPTTSPWPDGMPPLFFQHYWEHIGGDVLEAVQSFLQTGQLLKKINFTHICLIPKINNPEHMSDLRPIALCNVIYKIYSKSAFVIGRLIIDNILVANEIAHFVHNKRDGSDGFMALKLDLSKAYDRMEWASLEAFYELQDVFETYGTASGQLINFSKSSVVFSKNVTVEMQEEVSDFLGVEVVALHKKYLGLPTYVGRKKTSTFQYIKDRLAKKLAGWQGKLLSVAGKDILIRVVAHALPTYAMSVFELTKSFCEDLEQMWARFWWGSTLDKRKIHWKKWDALCNPKEEGGLGFRSLSNFNTAMLAKQAWRVLNNPSSLVARLYKAKYFPTGSFWDALPHESPSFSWRSIVSTKTFLQSNYCWQVGDGASIFVFSDNWVPASLSGKPTGSRLAVEEVHKVCDLMLGTGGWNVGLIDRLFSREEATLITAIPLSRRRVVDRLSWKLSRDGKFLVKYAYRSAFAHSSSYSPMTLPVGASFWKKLWQASIPSKAKIHIWRVCLDILPFLESLALKRVVLDSELCVLCETHREMTFHLCRDCPFTKELVQSRAILKQVWYNPQVVQSDLLAWMSFSATELSLSNFGELMFLLWGVWKERNERVWNQKNTAACDMDRLTTLPGRRGLGFVFRNELGHMLAGGACPLSGLISLEHAEILACKRVVEFAADHALIPAILETDA